MGDLNGKVILITGGTGSFGKKVTAKLLKEGEVSKIVILSRDEKKQHDMRLQFDNSTLQFEIGDVRDARRMSRVMRDVDMVFHAKH